MFQEGGAFLKFQLLSFCQNLSSFITQSVRNDDNSRYKIVLRKLFCLRKSAFCFHSYGKVVEKMRGMNGNRISLHKFSSIFVH